MHTTVEPARPALDLTFTTAPIDLPNVSAKFAADVAYGDGERNLFDIYLPECDDPTPLVIYIHGGGFTGGDKSSAHNDFADDVAGAKKGMELHNEAKKKIHKIPVENIDAMGQRLLQR